jgi:hypothetical protein
LPISFGKKRRCLRTNACTTTQNIVRKSIGILNWSYKYCKSVEHQEN